MSTPTLLQRYQQLRQEQSQLRQRDAARALGVSEAALVACLPQTIALHCQPAQLLPALAALGQLKSITRNQVVVHETQGAYRNLTLSEKTGLVLNPDGLDLRLFLTHWQHAYALRQPGPQGLLHSLQFFDAQGEAINKLYLLEEDKLPAWEKLVQTHRMQADAPAPAGISIAAQPHVAASSDTSGFADAWLALQDVHHFHALLKRYGLKRQQAFRLAPPGFAHRLHGSALTALLEGAAASALPIMAFVGNRGMVQIHTGPIKSVRRVGPWLNVLDPAFNLHILEDEITELWLVRRPTRDGVITSVEAFDAAGESVLSFFGQRREGEAELPAWRALAAALPAQEAQHAA
ncbi:hemin transport protein HmuS [Aquitalea magnusonii]|uniref:Hemin transport protein HmuS n=1 Tax=Aquitalea magnusonii TaxID=332411 RepID=A0A3G9GN37_9NEIS|nr:ChuX/HutX family heme-like substrate-binding protein [Aquitalea magnusonii]BBF86566.1 hemin transport protein HmuS [Aquitalea magnusonii]